MNFHVGDKAVLVSITSGAAIEAVFALPFDRLVSFGIQSAIGVCTIIYLLMKMYYLRKHKKE